MRTPFLLFSTLALVLLAAWLAFGRSHDSGVEAPAPQTAMVEPVEHGSALHGVPAGMERPAERAPVESVPASTPPQATESEGDRPELGTLAVSVEFGEPAPATAFAAQVVDRASGDQVAFVHRDWGETGPVRVTLPPGTYAVTLRECAASPPPLYLGASEHTETAQVRAGAEETLRIAASLGGRFELETRDVPAGRPLVVQARRASEEAWRDLRLLPVGASDELTLLLVATQGHRYWTPALEAGRWTLRVLERDGGAEAARVETDLLPGEIRNVTL